MSQKAEAIYHGADIVTRLRAQAPHSDDGQAMQEAAGEIEKLRPRVITQKEEFEVLPEGSVVVDNEGVAWQWSGLRFTTGVISNLTPYEFPRLRPMPARVVWSPHE